jgi:septum site-determining protein MinC
MATAQPAADVSAEKLFELKAGSFTLPTLRLLGTDMDGVAAGLSEKVDQAPDFFRNLPVVIDLKALQDTDVSVDFALLVGLLRGYGMIPFAVRGGSSAQHHLAEAMELAVLSDGGVKTRPAGGRHRSPPPDSGAMPRTRLVTQPVRSGQRVYASRGDLVVLASVGSGAEIMADGNIHVYGTLRGRALAGVKGDQQARIFCRDLQAELVSVAGNYRVSDTIDEGLQGKPVQVFLDQSKLRVETF